MCGLTGFLTETGARGEAEMCALARRMADTITHRGPDDAGAWADPDAGIALGFRRLSIIDLSTAGHQPMESASGRLVAVFNGEVYNAAEIRAELEAARLAPDWRGHSDTEVILAAVEAWGLAAAVSRFVGMFAIVLWDRRERALHLVRDRLGIKPLYYGRMGPTLLFGSELKALRAHPDFRADVDRGALALFLRHNYVPAPYSIYEGIAKLTPGCILTVRAGQSADPAPRPYWSAREIAEAGIADPFAGTDAEAVEQLESLLREAVRLRMVADVPLGAFLSSGVDSSLVVALMQAQSARPVQTFTIGFRDEAFDEARHARAVADHLQTGHTELIVSEKDVLAVVPELPRLYDEPFADSSQIPTYLVSQLARRSVTVSLSGDGGDELFAGYERYSWGNRLRETVGRVPRPLRPAAASALGLLAGLDPAPAPPGGGSARGAKLARIADMARAESPEALYRLLMSHWPDPARVVLGASEPPDALSDPCRWADLPDFTRRMMFLDLISYLPDDILTKVDRSSMGVSLEARVPLLDHRVAAFAWRLPLSLKVRDGQTKWALRQVLYRHVPRELIERPKKGFAVPLADWLRGPLRDWAEALLDESRLRREGFLDPAPVRRKWREHLSRRHNWHFPLWDVLMFQAWLEEEGVVSRQ